MTQPQCPYCNAQLAKMPQRKTKCAACRQPIYVKSTPDHRTKRLMTEAQAQVAEAAWVRRAFIERVSGIAPAMGLVATTVGETLSTAPNPELAWETMVSFRTIEAEVLHERRFALLVLADINARRGDRSALGCLREAARLSIEELRGTLRRVPRFEAGISPGSDLEFCQAMRKIRVPDLDEELRNPRLPNPQCPVSRWRIEGGFCTCEYAPYSADWNLLSRAEHLRRLGRSGNK